MDWAIGSGFLLGVFLLAFISTLIAGFVFWIVMLIDCIQRRMEKEDEKLIWILLMIFTGLLGSLIYFFMVYRKKQ